MDISITFMASWQALYEIPCIHLLIWMNPSISDELELLQWQGTQSSDSESNCTGLFIHSVTFMESLLHTKYYTNFLGFKDE